MTLNFCVRNINSNALCCSKHNSSKFYSLWETFSNIFSYICPPSAWPLPFRLTTISRKWQVYPTTFLQKCVIVFFNWLLLISVLSAACRIIFTTCVPIIKAVPNKMRWNGIVDSKFMFLFKMRPFKKDLWWPFLLISNSFDSLWVNARVSLFSLKFAD